ncbi:hypothetical protein UlMin_038663 [Ulmus minor]
MFPLLVFLVVCVLLGGMRLMVSAMYGPIGSAEKRIFWNDLHKAVAQFYSGWLVLGDFNGVLYHSDRHGGREETSSLVHMINALDNLGLVELPSQGLKYSWSNGRNENNVIRAKLDRCVANADWWGLFPNVDVKILPQTSSDHSPVVLNFDGCSTFLKRSFRFEAIWTRDKRSHWVVEHSWAKAYHSRPSTKLSKRLFQTRRGLSVWNREQFGKIQTRIKDTRKALEACQENLNPGACDQEKALRRQLEELLKCEELLWYQKAKVNWRLEGDRCSKFFFMSTMVRRKANKIDCIKLDNGDWISSRGQVGTHFVTRFEAIFDTPNKVQNCDLSKLVSHVITDEENCELLRIPTWDEVRDVVVTMGAFKAPGPNGMPVLFYKNYWNTVGHDLVAAVHEFFLMAYMPASINASSIVLIPRKPNPTRPNYFRPILVCNVVYRVITKLLANRLKLHLDRLICPTQNAFVPGKSIHDNSILFQEVIHSMKKKKKKDAHGWMGLKIDLEKAYDRLSSDFVKQVLVAFGFSHRWIQWISSCLSTINMKLLINGSFFGNIRPKRGLQQGDPTSPYIFILCTEVLSRLLLKKADGGDIHSFKLTRGGPRLHHLLFADDIFLFGEACEGEARQFKESLDLFYSWSGLSFNSTKSNMFFSANTRSRTSSIISQIMGFEHIPLTSCYLGLPMFRSQKMRDFNFLVECLDSKLVGWKARLLSKVGRLTLIK